MNERRPAAAGRNRYRLDGTVTGAYNGCNSFVIICNEIVSKFHPFGIMGNEESDNSRRRL